MKSHTKFVIISVSLGTVALFVSLLANRSLLACRSPQDRPGYSPKAGFVPDEKTALAVAKAVLTPVYGEKVLQSEEPFTASLDGDTWFVLGHMPGGPYVNGGVAELKISKSKGCILWMYHGK